MFSSGPDYTKLKTNLRLSINRLKLLEKKKTENALKARKEIADYIQANKDDRARIRVEHIVREDYYVEAMELIEMYCDLLLARFGLIQSQKELDPGLEEAIATLIWIAPRMQADVVELKAVGELLSQKYGKEFAMECRQNRLNNVSEKVMHKMSVQAPPKVLIEKYMIEIARSYNIPFEPDSSAMHEDEPYVGDLIGFSNTGAGGPPPPSSVPYSPPNQKFGPPPPDGGSRGSGGGGGGFMEPPGTGLLYPYAPGSSTVPPPLPSTGPVGRPVGFSTAPPTKGGFAHGPPSPCEPPPYTSMMSQPRNEATAPPANHGTPNELHLPDLPNVPTSPHQSVDSGLPPAGGGGFNTSGADDPNFDDLARRFEELKRRK